MSLAVRTNQQADWYAEDEEPLVPAPVAAAYAGTRLPDGRILAWREYGHPRGVPCVLIPDARSSRLAPEWLLHDSALPDGIRLIAIDRPGTGASDPIGFGGRETPAEDLSRLVQTLAVGRVVLVGVGLGADAALALADYQPSLVSSVMAVSVRTDNDGAAARRGGLFSRRTTRPPAGALDAWAKAARGEDLRRLQTWEHSRRRMDPAAQMALGNRWRDADFREAVAADLSLTADSWVHTEVPERPRWVSRWTSSVPVHCWHGREQRDTTVSDVRQIAASRRNWTVTSVPGSGALLGAWPAILGAAQDSYLRGMVR